MKRFLALGVLLVLTLLLAHPADPLTTSFDDQIVPLDNFDTMPQDYVFGATAWDVLGAEIASVDHFTTNAYEGVILEVGRLADGLTYPISRVPHSFDYTPVATSLWMPATEFRLRL